MLPTTASSISVSRAAICSGCSRLTRADRACASASVRSIPIWMRKRPSGLTAPALSPAEPLLPRTSVWPVHALTLVPGCGALRTCGGLSIDWVVVAGAGCGGGGGEPPPNQPAKGFVQPLLAGSDAAAGEVGLTEAVRAARATLGTGGAIGPPPSANPASL